VDPSLGAGAPSDVAEGGAAARRQLNTQAGEPDVTNGGEPALGQGGNGQVDRQAVKLKADSR